MSSDTSDSFESSDKIDTTDVPKQSRIIPILCVLFGVGLFLIGNFSISNYRIIFYGFLSALGLWIILLGIILFIGISNIYQFIYDLFLYNGAV